METSKSWPKRLFHLVRRSSAASQAHKKREHFTQRRPNEVRTLNGGALKTNVSRVSLCVVESLYWWMFDLYQFSVDDVRFLCSSLCIPNTGEQFSPVQARGEPLNLAQEQDRWDFQWEAFPVGSSVPNRIKPTLVVTKAEIIGWAFLKKDRRRRHRGGNCRCFIRTR